MIPFLFTDIVLERLRFRRPKIDRSPKTRKNKARYSWRVDRAKVEEITAIMNITSTYKRLQPDRYDAGGFPFIDSAYLFIGRIMFFFLLFVMKKLSFFIYSRRFWITRYWMMIKLFDFYVRVVRYEIGNFGIISNRNLWGKYYKKIVLVFLCRQRS